MKPLRIFLAICLLGLFTFSCEKNREEEIPEPYMESFADIEKCLSFTPLKGSQPGPNQSCILYNYDGDSVLKITHFNSAFNCCPEEILTTFEIRNDTIFISEDDSEELCRCNCLFNVEMTIHNLSPGKYVIKIEEPYVNQAEQIFVLDVDLLSLPMDQVCKYREFYPWHE